MNKIILVQPLRGSGTELTEAETQLLEFCLEEGYKTHSRIHATKTSYLKIAGYHLTRELNQSIEYHAERMTAIKALAKKLGFVEMVTKAN